MFTEEAVGTHRGFRYKVMLNDLGFRCGYVCLPYGHPWYEKDYADIRVQVHGGLTFSGYSSVLGYGFWIGFDCMHGCDAVALDDVAPKLRGTHAVAMMIEKEAVLDNPAFAESHPELAELRKALKEFTDGFGLAPFESKVRSRRYVESQCRNLAAACAEIKNK